MSTFLSGNFSPFVYITILVSHDAFNQKIHKLLGKGISCDMCLLNVSPRGNFALVLDKYLGHALENINKVLIEDFLTWSEKLPKEPSIKQYIK